MKRTGIAVLSLAFALCLGGLFSFEEATQAQLQGDDNKALCDIEEICLSSIVCDEDTGALDADGDLIALKDAAGTKVKKAAQKKVARKKATRKKATAKKATKKAATYQFNERRGDEITDMPSNAQLTTLFADLIGSGGFFEAIPSAPVCGNGVVESPEACEPASADTCGSGTVCSTNCSACFTVPQ